MSNGLDPDLARCFIRPDLGPNCLQRISADDTSRHRYFYCTDGTVGGNCFGNTESGCYDVNAGCRDNMCKCNDGFTDIDGTCTAGKSFLNILIA